MKKYFVFFFLIFIIACKDEDKPVDSFEKTGRDEAQRAFNYLNKVRANPGAYSSEIGVDLNYVQSRPALKWDANLQKAAERKAKDMATRNFFAHVDPDGYGMNHYINAAGYKLIPQFLKTISANNFESLAAGVLDGEKIIKMLILDKGFEADPGHRNHLLGIPSFWANCTDIGIGIAYNPESEYKYYCCVLVAKHDF